MTRATGDPGVRLKGERQRPAISALPEQGYPAPVALDRARKLPLVLSDLAQQKSRFTDHTVPSSAAREGFENFGADMLGARQIPVQPRNPDKLLKAEQNEAIITQRPAFLKRLVESGRCRSEFVPTEVGQRKISERYGRAKAVANGAIDRQTFLEHRQRCQGITTS